MQLLSKEKNEFQAHEIEWSFYNKFFWTRKIQQKEKEKKQF